MMTKVKVYKDEIVNPNINILLLLIIIMIESLFQSQKTHSNINVAIVLHDHRLVLWYVLFSSTCMWQRYFTLRTL